MSFEDVTRPGGLSQGSILGSCTVRICALLPMEPGNRLVEQQTQTASTFSCLVSEVLTSVA